MAEDYEELRVFDKEVKELTPEQKIEALIHTKKLDDTKNAKLTTELATCKAELEQALKERDGTAILMRLRSVRVDELHDAAAKAEQELERVKGELAGHKKLLADTVTDYREELDKAEQREKVLVEALEEAIAWFGAIESPAMVKLLKAALKEASDGHKGD